MAPSSLTEVLGGTKGISLAKSKKLVKLLRLSEDLGELFVLSARAQHARAAVDREAADKELAEVTAHGRSQPRTDAIVSWVTEAVLKLSERRKTRLDAEDLARRLGVPPPSVKFALRFLTRLGFLDSAPPSRAHLAYLGKGRRINVDYEPLLRRAIKATRTPGPRDTFLHEPLLLDPPGHNKALRLLERCIEDIKRLESRGLQSSLFYLTTQLFQAETSEAATRTRP